MGVAFQTRNVSGTKYQGQTEELKDWISKVRCKKNSIQRTRKRDLRLEAVLTSALSRAEGDLRTKQLQRYKRWQLMKIQLNISDNNFYTTTEQNMHWDKTTCEDLSSLDNFMSMLKDVKTSLHR